MARHSDEMAKKDQQQRLASERGEGDVAAVGSNEVQVKIHGRRQRLKRIFSVLIMRRSRRVGIGLDPIFQPRYGPRRFDGIMSQACCLTISWCVSLERLNGTMRRIAFRRGETSMARKRWLRFMAGTGLVLSVGCQAPNGPTNSVTLPGNTPPPVFPTQGSAATRPTSPNASLPTFGDSRTRIGTPGAQAAPVTTSAVPPKLKQQIDPSLSAAPQPNDVFPPPNNNNGLRSPSGADFQNSNFGGAQLPASPRYDSQVPLAPSGIAPSGIAPAIAPPPPITSLPNNLPPTSALPAYPPPTMPQQQYAFPAIPQPQAPAFPQTQNPANNFPVPNTPAAPNLSSSGGQRPSIYPQGFNQ
jgi:hypothetical protein